LVLKIIFDFNFSFSKNTSQGIVKRKIFDLENQLLLLDVNIMIKGTKFSSISDTDGYFITP